jgi:hypothetical protein
MEGRSLRPDIRDGGAVGEAAWHDERGKTGGYGYGFSPPTLALEFPENRENNREFAIF